MNLTYNYGSVNNGQIQGITDNINPSQSTSYFYDELGRLKTAQTTDLVSPGTWKLSFKYDRYGNRLSQIPQGGTASMPLNEVAVDPTTNRISGFQYDAAGNATNDGLHSYGYDAENRLTKIDGGAETFVYDASGMRVKKNATVYIYESGHVIAEYANGAPANSPTAEYAGRFASFSGGTTTYFYHDHLSNRFLANSSGTVTGTLAQFPFGEITSGSFPTKWAFTNYERDNAAGDSGLDYAYARFYSNRLGRFMSMDPLSGSLGNPQSLNRYAYSANDPINKIDPTGMLTGNLTCELLDNGDCRGGNGYAPGGGAFGDPFGVNDDPFGNWTDPTRSDPLAEGEARYTQQVGQAFAAGTTGSDGNGNTYTWNGDHWVKDWNGEQISAGAAAEAGLGIPSVNVYPGGSGTEYFQKGRLPPGADPQGQANSANTKGVPKTDSPKLTGENGPNGASPKDTPELQNKAMQDILDMISDWLDGGLGDFLFCFTCGQQNKYEDRWRGPL
jgi:RHS repeat-associated protein